jgi:hypothetical protein
MPRSLTLRTTAVLVALAFGLTFVLQSLLGGGPPAAKPAAKKSVAGFVAEGPDAAPDLRLVTTPVPGLRQPRQPRQPEVDRRKPAVRKVVRAPGTTPAPMTPAPRVQPTPTAAPRHVTPTPAAPEATPAPTAPPSGEFDTGGQP